MQLKQIPRLITLTKRMFRVTWKQRIFEERLLDASMENKQISQHLKKIVQAETMLEDIAREIRGAFTKKGE